MHRATFAGGCFWCTHAVYAGLKGVTEVQSGYAGGEQPRPSYEDVASGRTQHREAVQILYEPNEIGYEELLTAFWESIDPTDPEGQFADRGHQYTTAIYTHNPEQRRLAEQSKHLIEERLGQPVHTEILEYTTFYPAEDHHQDYAEKHPVRYALYKTGSGRATRLKQLWT